MQQKKALALPQLHPLSWARMLYKRRLGIVLTWILLSTLCLVAVRMMPPIYRAETTILVISQNIPQQIVGATVNDDVSDRLATISKRVLSSTGLQKIVQTFNLYPEERKVSGIEDITERMRGDINVTLERGWTRNRPGAFRIAYENGNASLAADVANQLGNLFIEENFKVRESNAEGTTEFLDSQLAEAQKRLGELEQKVSEYKRTHSGELPQQENSLLGTLTRLNTELQGNQDAISRIQQNKIVLENALALSESAEYPRPQQQEEDSPAVVRTPAASRSGASASSSRVTSQQLLKQLELLKIRYSDDHPDVKRLKIDIANVQALEAKQLEEGRGELGELKDEGQPAASVTSARRLPVMTRQDAELEMRRRERITSLRSQIQVAEDELRNRNEDRARILRDIASAEARIGRLPVREQEMASLTRDYENSQKHYNSLLDKKFGAEMAADMERRQKAERFAVLDPARVPDRPVKPNRIVLAGLGCLIAMAISLIVFLGWELVQNQVLGHWELPPDLPVLARIPEIRPADPDEGGTSARKRWFQRWRVVAGPAAMFVIAVSTAVSERMR